VLPTLFSIVSISKGSSAAKIIASISLSSLDFFLGKSIMLLFFIFFHKLIYLAFNFNGVCFAL
jgi:hypothetical protein